MAASSYCRFFSFCIRFPEKSSIVAKTFASLSDTRREVGTILTPAPLPDISVSTLREIHRRLSKIWKERGACYAANYMFNKADPDGLTVGDFNSGMVTQQALGSRGVRFDARKFGWIGAPVKGFPSCMIMGFTGLRTLDDVINASSRLKFAGTRAGASGVDLPHLMNALMGTRLQVIAGYKGTSETRLAMQRREADGICSGWESMRVTARSMLDASGDDKLIPFIIHGNINDPEVKNLPQFTERLKGEDDLAAFRAWANQYDFQRPLVVPPKTPRDRLRTLRAGLQKTLTDPEFLAEAKNSKMLVDNVTGEDAERSVNEILSISPQIKNKLQFLVPGSRVAHQTRQLQ